MIRETSIRVRRTARLAVLAGQAGDGEGEGEGPGGQDAPSRLWIGLHGYRQLARRFLRPFVGHVPVGSVLLAPEGGSRFYLEGAPGPHRGGDPVGASWMTREDRDAEIRDYTQYLDDVLEAAILGSLDAVPPLALPLHLGVLGFSQGVHTASRWISGSQVLPEAIRSHAIGSVKTVLWGASLPSDLPGEGVEAGRGIEGLRSGHDLVLVRGDEDSLRSPDAEAREEAWLAEAQVPCRIETHPGGHRVDGALAAALLSG